jgi:uncharacterized membrane protein YbhN (UPF0104 family)
MKVRAVGKKVVKGLVAVLLMGYLVTLIDWISFVSVLRNIQPEYLVGYVILQCGGVALSVKKWQVVAKARELNFVFYEGLQAYLLGMFLNNFFPSTIGGDIYRGRFLGKKSGHMGQALYTVFFERLQGLWLLLLTTFFFALLYSTFILQSTWLSFVVLLTVGAFGASFPLFFLLQTEYCSSWQWITIFGTLLQKWGALLQKDFREFSWTKGLGTTALFIFVGPFLSNLFLFWSLGSHPPLPLFFFLVTLAALVSSIPLSFGNIGIKEGVYIILFGLIGVPLELSIAVVFLSRVAQLGISLLALPGYLRARS